MCPYKQIQAAPEEYYVLEKKTINPWEANTTTQLAQEPLDKLSTISKTFILQMWDQHKWISPWQHECTIHHILFLKGFQISLDRLHCPNPKKFLLAIKSSYYFSAFLSLMAISPQNLSKTDTQIKIKYFFTTAKLFSSNFKTLIHQFCLLYWTFIGLNFSCQTQEISIHFGASL